MDISETVEVKGHEKCIFETPHNEIECVLSVKESNFNEKKKDQNFHISLRSRLRWLTPPPCGQPDRKICGFFWTPRPECLTSSTVRVVNNPFLPTPLKKFKTAHVEITNQINFSGISENIQYHVLNI